MLVPVLKLVLVSGSSVDDNMSCSISALAVHYKHNFHYIQDVMHLTARTALQRTMLYCAASFVYGYGGMGFGAPLAFHLSPYSLTTCHTLICHTVGPDHSMSYCSILWHAILNQTIS